MPPGNDLTLVIDIGKSHAKLLMVSAEGEVVARHGRNNAAVVSPLGYPALDVAGLTQWMQATLAASVHTRRCGHAIVSTHGAAFVGLGENGLAWAPLDYEFEGCTQPGSALDVAYRQACDPFEQTFSPDLPMGLNAARQLYWLQQTHPAAWAATRILLPYPQYWAWWLSGVASTEVSSLGCHTQLWHPATGQYARLAQSQGWAARFAPVRQASEVLGPVRPDLADALGLPEDCQVHVGVHDSNACLARYLSPDAGSSAVTQDALTLISSGTWTVIMAADARVCALAPERDMLCNVSVLGQPTPTARFMGGREFAALLAGASPHAGTPDDVLALMHSQTFALPSFAPQGGPFMRHSGQVWQGGQVLAWQHMPETQRSALAALYCAQLTAWLVRRLRPELETPQATPPGGTAQRHRLVVEGPLATNALYLGVLQALLPCSVCFASRDDLEGTARGAWLLSQWERCGPADSPVASALEPVAACVLPGLADYHAAWLHRLLDFS